MPRIDMDEDPRLPAVGPLVKADLRAAGVAAKDVERTIMHHRTNAARCAERLTLAVFRRPRDAVLGLHLENLAILLKKQMQAVGKPDQAGCAGGVDAGNGVVTPFSACLVGQADL